MISRNLLDPIKVKEGKREGIEWVLKQNLFDYVPQCECSERRPYSSKWVLKNKGEKVRVRLVVRETVFDVSRAHFYGVCERDVYVEPRRCTECNAWQKLWCEHLRSNGFELGASNLALYRSELVNGFCHGDGDDFVTAAAEDQIEVFGKMLQETDRHDWCSKTS